MSAKVAFAELRIGDEIPSLTKTVQREDILAYADASTDRNPLHVDDDFAKAAGFPGMIAHGMFTMAHLTTCLTDWLGDPHALRYMRVLFRSAVVMGDTMVAGGKVVHLDADSKRVRLDVWVAVEREGRKDFAIRRSRAEVELA